MEFTNNLKELEVLSSDDNGLPFYMASHIKHSINNGKNKVSFIIKDCISYPNICAPLAGIIDYYKKKNIKIIIKYTSEGKDYISKTSLESPIPAESDANNNYIDNPFDIVWSFETPSGINKILNAYLLSLKTKVVAKSGCFESLIWCLSETMDNVLTHSEANKGFVMASFHKKNNLFSVCVFDNGVGIFNSLSKSKTYHPATAIDAITLALQEKVTRDNAIGQGNGLYGLRQIILLGKGKLKIISDGAVYAEIEGNKPNVDNKQHLFSDKKYGSTSIDFQIYLNNPVDVGTALNGYTPIDLWNENLEDEKENYVLKIKELKMGTGTRPAASSVKKIALNLATNAKKK